MLQTFSKQEDIPEALREHYSRREDGKYHADIPNEHPAVTHSVKLLNEKKTVEQENTTLKADLESAKASGLPRGHVAIPKAEAQLLEEVKELGSVADVKAKLAEHVTLKTEVDKRKREDNLKTVAKELGYDNVDAFIRLPGLPDFEIREKDGKKSVIAKVPDGDKIVERPATEFIESSADIAPFLSALKTSSGTSVHGSSSGGGVTADPFKSAREFAESHNKAQAATVDVGARFGLAPKPVAN